MTDVSSSPTRRSLLVGSAAVGAASILTAHFAVAVAPDVLPGQPPNQGEKTMASTEDDAIRPFRFNASDEALADLRRRVAGTNGLHGNW